MSWTSFFKRLNTRGTTNQDFSLQDASEPNLYKEVFPYSEIPKISFTGNHVPVSIPEDIWITDTTFRDGQQSMQPFTAEQILALFQYLHQLDNHSGIIRQTEFFLFSKKDQDAIERCLSMNYKFPEITSWIRANLGDLELVKKFGIKETGILMSCSDYHIFKKLKVSRKEAFDKYISVAEKALENGIIPRCHLEDITRADFFGFVVPFVNKLTELSKQAGIPVKIRACDTLGLGVSYPGAALPRSVQGIIYGLQKYCNLPSSNLEWHGHNDFYGVVTNSTTAWLHGCASVSTTLLGIGERTGNCPLEAMAVEYAQIKGTAKNLQLDLITEIANYFEREIGYKIPLRTPFVGAEFNMTRAGIHADGVLKDEEIYNIFDTDKILGRPIQVAVNEYSGLAGIAAWINTYFHLSGVQKIDKKDPRVEVIKVWIDKEYAEGRNTVIGNLELELVAKKHFPELFQKEGTIAG